MDDVFGVTPFSIENLKNILCEKTEIPPERLNSKLHIQYFEGYFPEIGAQTIVVENNYVDHDYLDDHAEYYVRCFKKYRRKCTRLHFFRKKFSEENLKNLLMGDKTQLSIEILQKKYLGFIVIKPLPQTIFGRTCLINYPHENRRYFPIVRSYSANLFGIKLTVEHSLAFQEQDTVVAACATSALWSVFQGTGKLFQHAIPSPSSITKSATEYITDGQRSRSFPSKGLDAIEMARAIKNIDLEPNPVNVENGYILKSTSYAYLRMGIPMILGFPLYSTTSVPNTPMGKHAVALTGYSLPIGNPIKYSASDFKLVANRIDKLYAHDDQVGPFARMVFDGNKIILHDSNGQELKLESLSTSWRAPNGDIGSARALPEILLIPLYNKIRIPFGVIHDQIMEFDPIVNFTFKSMVSTFPTLDNYEWDIYLTTVNDIKTEHINETTVDSQGKLKTLTANMPKYIWRATLLYDSNKVLDILFDATDIEQGAFVILVVSYHTDYLTELIRIIKEPFIQQSFGQSSAWPIINRIIQFN